MKTTFTKKEIYILFLNIYLMCLPLNAMRLGSLGSALKIIAVLPLFVAFSEGIVRCEKLLNAQVLFTIFAGISIVWSFSRDDSFGRVISYVELLALLFSGSVFDYSLNDIKKIKKALVWSSRFTAIVVLRYATYYGGRLRLMGIIKEDPNYLCAYFTFGVIFAVQEIMDGDKVWKKILGAAEVILYLYLVFVSGSRGGLLAIGAGVVALLLTSLGKNNIKTSVGIILAFIVLIVVANVLIDYLPSNLQARFTIADVVSDGGSGRLEIWSNGIDLYSKSSIFRWIFGYGTATTKYCFKFFHYSQVNVMHNMYLETLLELGIVGLALYVLAVFKFTQSAFFLKDKFSFAVIVCMIIMSLSTSIYTFKPYFNIMLYIIISCFLCDSINKNKELGVSQHEEKNFISL